MPRIPLNRFAETHQTEDSRGRLYRLRLALDMEVPSIVGTAPYRLTPELATEWHHQVVDTLEAGGWVNMVDDDGDLVSFAARRVALLMVKPMDADDDDDEYPFVGRAEFLGGLSQTRDMD